MKKPIPGIQLYTLRDHIQTPEDFDRTLSRLSRMGVRDVQISAIGDFPAGEQKRILDQYGMSVCVTHKPLEKMEADLSSLIEDQKTIACDALGLGCPPERLRGTLKNAETLIGEIVAFADVLYQEGMTFHYHNHDFEFRPLEGGNGETLMDLLLERTDPEKVKFIPDVMWMHFAGVDPVSMLYKMKGRVKVLHFKDYVALSAPAPQEKKFVSLGRGIVDLKALYEAACALEIPYIVYEQDADWTGDDPFLATAESWAFLTSLS